MRRLKIKLQSTSQVQAHCITKSKTDDILLVQNSSSTRLPACVIFSFGNYSFACI